MSAVTTLRTPSEKHAGTPRCPLFLTTSAICLICILLRFWSQLSFNPYLHSSHLSTLSHLPVRTAVGYHRCPPTHHHHHFNFNSSLVDPDRNAIVFPIMYLNNSNYKRISTIVASATYFSNLPVVLLMYQPALSEPHMEALLLRVREEGVRNNIIQKRVDVPFNASLVAHELRICRGDHACPALADFSIMHVFGLMFRKVIVLDWRIKFLKTFHHLLVCDEDLIYTSSRDNYIDLGMMVVRTNRPELVLHLAEYYQQLVSISHAPYKNPAHVGDHQASGIGSLPTEVHSSTNIEHVKFLVNAPQRFLYHYFVGKPRENSYGVNKRTSSQQFKTVEVSHCMYLFQGDDALCAEEFRVYGLPVFVGRGRPHGRSDVLNGLGRLKRRCVVDSWILGARKGGTTALYTYLSKHPAVVATHLEGKPGDGEMKYKFLGTDVNAAQSYNAVVEKWLNKSEYEYDEREWAVDDLSSRNRIFDSSVQRLVNDPWPLVQACGHRTNRFAVVLRDPISRCISQMQMRARLQKNGMSTETNVSEVIERELVQFLNATRGRTDWMDDAIPEMLFTSSQNCIYEGLYAAHLKRWLYYVGREQLHVTLTEELGLNAEFEFRELLKFFDLDAKRYNFSHLLQKHNNAPLGQSRNPNFQLTAALRSRLDKVVQPYNRALENLIGIPLNW